MRNFIKTGIITQFLFISIAAVSGSNSVNDNLKSSDVVLHTHIPVLAQTLSSDMSSSINITPYTATAGDKVLSEDKENEELYGYKAMKYSDENYNYDLPYRLYVPENYQEEEKYPLVVFLHGGGKKGSDNVSQIENMAGSLAFVKAEVQQKYPSFVLAPQCPKNDNWIGKSHSGSRMPESLEDIKPSTVNLMVMDLLKNIQDRYGIDSTRIYLTGQSMGGIGTWYLSLMSPNKFAAIAPVCGVSLPSEVSLIADMPVWAFHGADDTTIPPEGSRQMIDALRDAGNNNVKYTEYPNVGHESWYKAYKEADLIDWMFSKERE